MLVLPAITRSPPSNKALQPTGYKVRNLGVVGSRSPWRLGSGSSAPPAAERHVRWTAERLPFPVDERWLRQAEQSLGRLLPDSYRERMMRDNGGEIQAAGDTWLLYPVYDQSDRKRIKRTCNHILLETRSAASWAGFPQEAVAIASNGLGDQLTFLPDEQDSRVFEPCVYFWNHETRELEPVADFGDLAG